MGSKVVGAALGAAVGLGVSPGDVGGAIVGFIVSGLGGHGTGAGVGHWTVVPGFPFESSARGHLHLSLEPGYSSPQA